MIYHVVTKDKWQRSLEAGSYEPESLAIEGFIHASGETQVAGVLQRYYNEPAELLLLHIDESKLMAELRYEYSRSLDENFPHIYGRLNIDAVVKVTPI